MSPTNPEVVIIRPAVRLHAAPSALHEREYNVRQSREPNAGGHARRGSSSRRPNAKPGAPQLIDAQLRRRARLVPAVSLHSWFGVPPSRHRWAHLWPVTHQLALTVETVRCPAAVQFFSRAKLTWRTSVRQRRTTRVSSRVRRQGRRAFNRTEVTRSALTLRCRGDCHLCIWLGPRTGQCHRPFRGPCAFRRQPSAQTSRATSGHRAGTHARLAVLAACLWELEEFHPKRSRTMALSSVLLSQGGTGLTPSCVRQCLRSPHSGVRYLGHRCRCGSWSLMLLAHGHLAPKVQLRLVGHGGFFKSPLGAPALVLHRGPRRSSSHASQFGIAVAPFKCIALANPSLERTATGKLARRPLVIIRLAGLALHRRPPSAQTLGRTAHCASQLHRIRRTAVSRAHAGGLRPGR